MGASTTLSWSSPGQSRPIRDGSFQDYVHAVASVGLVEQDAPAPVIEVKHPLTVDCKSGASYVATPADDFRLSATIQFAHPVIGRQYGSFEITPESFERELAPARTFGFRADAEALLARGLAQGASLDNTVVLDEVGVLNEGLRFPDEFLRHKVGDVVGDLALLGSADPRPRYSGAPEPPGQRRAGACHRRGGFSYQRAADPRRD